MCILCVCATEPPQDHKTAHLCFSLCPFFVSLFFSCLASFYIFLRLSSEFRILTCELQSPTLQVAALFFWWWIGAGGRLMSHCKLEVEDCNANKKNKHKKPQPPPTAISKGVRHQQKGWVYWIPLFVCHSSCLFLNILTFATVCKTKLPKKTVRYEMATHFSFAPAISHFPLWSCHRGMDCFIRSQADSGLLSQR